MRRIFLTGLLFLCSSGIARAETYYIAGTEKNPTVLRSEVKWKAVVVGSPQACFSTQDDCHWLTKGSPAIGKGSPEYSPATDFWGRSTSKDKAADLGAFPFVPALVEPAYRADWYFGWAYGYSPNRQPAEKANDMPDLWTLPASANAPAAR